MTTEERKRLVRLAHKAIGEAWVSLPFNCVCPCGFDLVAAYENQDSVPYMTGCYQCSRSFCE